jgi:hypothetical protein
MPKIPIAQEVRQELHSTAGVGEIHAEDFHQIRRTDLLEEIFLFFYFYNLLLDDLFYHNYNILLHLYLFLNHSHVF